MKSENTAAGQREERREKKKVKQFEYIYNI